MKTPAEIARLEEIRAGAELGRLAGHLLAAGEGSYMQALELATRRKSSEKIQNVLKGAIGANTTTTGAALEAIRPISDAFLLLLRGPSFFDNVSNDAIRMPLRTRAVVASGGGTGAVVGEGAPTPLVAFSYAAPALEPVKVQGIVVVSQELVRAGGTALESALNREIRDVIARTTNEHFISQITPTGSPSPDITSGGNDADDVLNDLTDLLGALTTDPFSRVHFAMHDDLCKVLSLMKTSTGALAFPAMTLAGGFINSYAVTATRELAAGEVLAVDASKFGINVGEITIDRSEQASLEFESEPTAAPTASTVFKSLWQMNMAALKVERTLAFTQLSTGAVAKLVNAQWGQ